MAKINGLEKENKDLKEMIKDDKKDLKEMIKGLLGRIGRIEGVYIK